MIESNLVLEVVDVPCRYYLSMASGEWEWRDRLGPICIKSETFLFHMRYSLKAGHSMASFKLAAPSLVPSLGAPSCRSLILEYSWTRYRGVKSELSNIILYPAHITSYNIVSYRKSCLLTYPQNIYGEAPTSADSSSCLSRHPGCMEENKSDAAGTTATAGANTVPAFGRRKTPQRRALKQSSIAVVEGSTSNRSLALIIASSSTVISGMCLWGTGIHRAESFLSFTSETWRAKLIVQVP